MVSFKLYLRHLNPLNEFLFQRPERNFSTFKDVWYDNMVVGERTLGEKIKNISQTYTNHSIWATAVTILDKSGFEARHYINMKPASRAITKLTFAQRRCGETLTACTRCEVSEELSVINSHHSSPFLILSQEEAIINSSCSEITKNFNFFNCNHC